MRDDLDVDSVVAAVAAESNADLADLASGVRTGVVDRDIYQNMRDGRDSIARDLQQVVQRESQQWVADLEAHLRDLGSSRVLDAPPQDEAQYDSYIDRLQNDPLLTDAAHEEFRERSEDIVKQENDAALDAARDIIDVTRDALSAKGDATDAAAKRLDDLEYRVERAEAVARGETDPALGSALESTMLELESAKLEVDYLESVMIVRGAAKDVQEHSAMALGVALKQAEHDHSIAEFAVTAATNETVDPRTLDVIAGALDAGLSQQEGLLEAGRNATDRVHPNVARMDELDAAYRLLKAEFPQGIPTDKMQDLADQARDIALDARAIADEEIPQIDAWTAELSDHEEPGDGPPYISSEAEHDSRPAEAAQPVGMTE